MLLYITLDFYFSSMLAFTSVIFAVGFMVYGVIGNPISEENVNNPELTQLDTFWEKWLLSIPCFSFTKKYENIIWISNLKRQILPTLFLVKNLPYSFQEEYHFLHSELRGMWGNRVHLRKKGKFLKLACFWPKLLSNDKKSNKSEVLHVLYANNAYKSKAMPF